MEPEIKTGPILTHNIKTIHIAGDVSATNTLMAVYSQKTSRQISTIFKAIYPGQEITDFPNQVITDILQRTQLKPENIETMVLAAAGPIISNTCQMTNAPFFLNAQSMGINTVLINDFRGIAFGVSQSPDKINTMPLEHICGKPGKAKPKGRILIAGPGTGYGVTRLGFNTEMEKYVPEDSEGGHKFLSVDYRQPQLVRLANYLSDQYFDGKLIHDEAILSGKGIIRVANFFIKDSNKEDSLEVKTLRQLETIEQQGAYIAQRAKENPQSVFGITMDTIWKTLGRSLRSNAIHELATGGVYIAGGSTRKDILTQKNTKDTHVEYTIMNEFDNGPTHEAIIRKMPVKVIMEKEIGLQGASYVALNPDLFQYELKRATS